MACLRVSPSPPVCLSVRCIFRRWSFWRGCGRILSPSHRRGSDPYCAHTHTLVQTKKVVTFDCWLTPAEDIKPHFILVSSSAASLRPFLSPLFSLCLLSSLVPNNQNKQLYLQRNRVLKLRVVSSLPPSLALSFPLFLSHSSLSSPLESFWTMISLETGRVWPS